MAVSSCVSEQRVRGWNVLPQNHSLTDLPSHTKKRKRQVRVLQLALF
jgi:hypothetical protein